MAWRNSKKAAKLGISEEKRILVGSTFIELMAKKKKRTLVTVSAETPDGKSIRKTLLFSADYCRYFHNAQHLLLQLDRGERAFYDYLCEHMDAANIVTIDQDLRREFVAFIARVTSQKTIFSDASATKYTTKLNSLGLIIKEGGGNTGVYMVNPRYAFAGTEATRKSLLEEVIREKVYSGKSVRHLINMREEQFLS